MGEHEAGTGDRQAGIRELTVVGNPMDVKTWTPDEPRVPKARETIEIIDPGLKVVDRKVFNVLLGHSFEVLRHDPHAMFSAATADIRRAIGWTAKGGSVAIRKAMERLQQTVVKFVYASEDGGLRDRNLSLLITTDVPHADGMVYWQFHPELAPYLANPREYGMIYLTVNAKFTSGYALRLYEILTVPVQMGQTEWTVGIDQLRKVLGATEASYDHFGMFNRKVLAVAVAELNDYAPFHVEVERHMDGRRVEAVTFRITRRDIVIDVKPVAVQPGIQLCLDLHRTAPPSAGEIDATAARVLRRSEDLIARFPGWPVEALAKAWAAGLLAIGKSTDRPMEAFEQWMRLRYGHLYRDGAPLAVDTPGAVESWIDSDVLEKAALAVQRMRPAQRKRWVAAARESARRRRTRLTVTSMDLVEVHAWLPLVADSLLLAFRDTGHTAEEDHTADA